MAHSLSPAFQNAALQHLGIPVRYEALDVQPAALAATLQTLAAEGAAGNVTIPHKVAVAQRARCTPLAQRAGAVNTFWFDDGQLMGDNTDVAGVVAALEQLRAPLGGAPRAVTVLGAGGSAAAVLIALETLGVADIRVAARDATRGAAVLRATAVAGRVVPWGPASVAGSEVVINATSIGLSDDADPVAMDAIATGAAVLDLVYRPGETAWVRRARAAGHPAADGRVMLLEQGIAAFARWFHRPAPRDVMAAALDRALAPQSA